MARDTPKKITTPYANVSKNVPAYLFKNTQKDIAGFFRLLRNGANGRKQTAATKKNTSRSNSRSGSNPFAKKPYKAKRAKPALSPQNRFVPRHCLDSKKRYTPIKNGNASRATKKTVRKELVSKNPKSNNGMMLATAAAINTSGKRRQVPSRVCETFDAERFHFIPKKA